MPENKNKPKLSVLAKEFIELREKLIEAGFFDEEKILTENVLIETFNNLIKIKTNIETYLAGSIKEKLLEPINMTIRNIKEQIKKFYYDNGFEVLSNNIVEFLEDILEVTNLLRENMLLDFEPDLDKPESLFYDDRKAKLEKDFDLT